MKAVKPGRGLLRRRIGGRVIRVFAWLMVPAIPLMSVFCVDYLYAKKMGVKSMAHQAYKDLELRIKHLCVKPWLELKLDVAFDSHNRERLDVLWISPDGQDLKVDITWPRHKSSCPLLVLFHGGSWTQGWGDKKELQCLSRYMASRGYTVFNFNYRMAPDYKVPVQVEDAMAAVIWAKDHAREYNGDPSRVAVGGHSAGAHLATMVAIFCGDTRYTPAYKSKKGHDCSVDLCVSGSGYYNFYEWPEPTPSQPDGITLSFLLGDIEERPELVRQCSPFFHVTKGMPVQLVLYGGKDHLRDENEAWVRKLREKGARVQYHLQPGMYHHWIGYDAACPGECPDNICVPFCLERYWCDYDLWGVLMTWRSVSAFLESGWKDIEEKGRITQMVRSER